jgi:hypothetical protein
MEDREQSLLSSLFYLLFLCALCVSVAYSVFQAIAGEGRKPDFSM